MTNGTRKNLTESKKLAAYAIMAGLVMLTVELFSYVVLRYVIIPMNPSLIYVPPYVDPVLYADYSDYRHPVLGWSTAAPNERRYSAKVESRPNPAYPNETTSCVSIYGDSFTFGSEVDDSQAWGNQLSILLGCKVANFGYGGYGSDQAYLRYSLNEGDVSQINILGIYPYNVLRNLNQYRPFLAGPRASSIGLKPRFIYENNDIRLIPPPEFTHDKLVEATKTPDQYFPYETFLPDSAHGSPSLSFPNTLVLLRFAMSKGFRNFVLKQPSWIEFLEDDHPTNAIDITDKITQRFADLSVQRGGRSIVVIFPTISSFRYYKRTGNIATQPISTRLESNSISHIDTHQGISDYLGERDYCELLVNPEECSGHLNPEGNELIANLLKTHIDTQSLSPAAHR